jgi:hypothetical protein
MFILAYIIVQNPLDNDDDYENCDINAKQEDHVRRIE